jgi:hypothetical protein
LKLKYDKALSNFAIKFNLRRCSEVDHQLCNSARCAVDCVGNFSDWSHECPACGKVGQCRFLVSKPVLRSRLVPALETKM